MAEHKIAALYCRISKGPSGEDASNSIVTQKQLLSKVALQYGYTRTQFFIDDGVSGTTFDRPALKKLEKAIQAGYIGAVLVKDISRLGRDYLKVGSYLEQFFPEHNVRFITVSGGIDSESHSIDFVPLYSVMDEWYARDISRKLRLMYQTRASAGIPVGMPIYGYKRGIMNPKQWIPNEETAPVVQRIYQMAFYGYGTEQIARALERDKILSPSGYRAGGNGNTTQNFRWRATTIAAILRDQRYCGDVIGLKTYSKSYKDKKRHLNTPENLIIFRDVHAPVVERMFWEYVQSKLNLCKTRRKAKEQISLFSGFLRCGDCGSNLHFHFNQGNPKIEYYNCSNYAGNRGTCPDTHYVRLDYLTDFVRKELNCLIRKSKADGFWQDVFAKKNIKAQEEIALRKEELHRNIQRQEMISNLLRMAYEDKVQGVIDDETFALLSASYKQERKTLRSQEPQLQSYLELLQNSCSRMLLFQKALMGQAEVEVLTRDTLGKFVNWIAVYPADRSVKPYKQKIEIHFHFIGKL